MILEGRLECAILYDALKPIPEDSVVQVPEPAADFRARLDSQTHHLEKHNPELQWDSYPTFTVTEDDAGLVLAAAELIIVTDPFPKHPAKYLKRYEQREYERRQKAARSIAAAISIHLYPLQGQLQ